MISPLWYPPFKAGEIILKQAYAFNFGWRVGDQVNPYWFIAISWPENSTKGAL